MSRATSSSIPHPLAASAPPWSAARPLGRAARLAGVLALLGAALAVGVPLCPVALVTRHPCPGCGLTRAALALAAGRLDEALRLHPLSIVLVPTVGAAMAYNALVYVRDGRFTAATSLQGRWVTAAAVVLGVAGLVVWIARFFGAFGGPVPV